MRDKLSLFCILCLLASFLTGCSLSKTGEDVSQGKMIPPGEGESSLWKRLERKGKTGTSAPVAPAEPVPAEPLTIKMAGEQALISDEIRCISAGSDSLWVGTDRGVSVYSKSDNRWIAYDREDGLISDDVTSIAVDGKLVWIGTRCGVSLYDRDKDNWISFQKRDGLADNRISVIAVDGNYVWFGTESGISRYDKVLGAWSLKWEKGKDDLNKITSIAVETEYVWFGTQAGLERYDKLKDSWNVYTEKDGLIQDHVSCIALGKDAVWVGTEKSGMSMYSKTNQAFTKTYTKNDFLESNFIKAIAVDGSSLWFGSADNGIRRYITTVDTWSKYTSDQGLVSNHITCLTVDGNDIWIGTYERGLCRYDKVNNNWTYYSRRDYLTSNHIKSLSTMGEGVWVGTTDGLCYYDASNGSWKAYTKASGLVTNHITCVVFHEETRTLWVGTPLGLGKRALNFSRGTGDFPHASAGWTFYTQSRGLADDFVTCVSAQDNSVWVGTKGGLSVMETDGWRTYLEGEWITAVLATGTEIWAGTTRGLYRRDADKDQFELYPEIECYVDTFSIDGNGNLLVGSQEGLWLINIRQPTTDIRRALPDLNIKALVADGDRIWAGTPQGVVCLLYNDDWNSIRSPSFTIEQPVSSISIAGDKVFLGTTSGLAIFTHPGGVLEYHRTSSTQILREESVNWMEQDGHYLWVLNWSASPNGAILRFDSRTHTWVKYTKEEIPMSSEVPYITEVRRAAVESDSVWFATNGGVLRYDKGSDTWRHFTRSSGLPGHRALFVEMDPPNYVWVAFRGGVASCYDKRTDTWETIQVTDAGVGTNIDGIAFTDEYVWFSTGSTGVRRYDRKTRTWISYSEADGMASREGLWIVADGRDVWTGGWGTYSWVSGMGSGGVSRYDAAHDRWSIYDRSKGLLASDGTQYGQVSDDYVWCFGYSGVNRYDKVNAEWVSFTQSDGIPDYRVTGVAEDGSDLWIGTGSKGVARYHRASGTWTSFTKEDGLIADNVNEYSLKVDSKYVWVGTPKGLSRYDKEKRTWVSFTMPINLASRRALAVAVEPRYVWVGTHCGLSRYDKQHDTWKHFQKEEEERRYPWEPYRPEPKKEKKENELVNNNVVGLSVDDRYVWIATEGGVGRYDKVADRFESYTKENQIPSNDVRAISEDRSHVWIGTRNGISRHNILSDDKNAWETYNTAIEVRPMVMKSEYARSLVNDDVRCLAAQDSKIWAGTKTGISLYDVKRGVWNSYSRQDGLASDEVSCIAADGEKVWFGSGRGVTEYDTRNNKWRVLTESDGLISNLVTSIATSKRYICFGTFDKGITIFHKDSRTFTSYTKEDGLPHNGILSLAIDGDLIWIGTHGGLTRYDTLTRAWTVYTEAFDWDGI